jgi:hypothetical protein
LFGNHFEIVFEKIAKSPPQKCEVSWTKALLPISSKSHSAAKSNFSKNHIPKRFLEIEKKSQIAKSGWGFCGPKRFYL